MGAENVKRAGGENLVKLLRDSKLTAVTFRFVNPTG